MSTTSVNSSFTDTLTAEAGQRSFEVSREYVIGTVSVFRNGTTLIPNLQFAATQGTYVDILIDLSEGDEIVITGFSAEPFESETNPGTSFFDRLGFDFDKNKFGSALTVSGYNQSFYSNNPIKLKQWQKNLLKSGVYRNYYRNPLAEPINDLRTNITQIRNTIIQVIAANTPKFITSALGTVTQVKEGVPIPAGKANANTLKVLANTANVVLNSLNVFRSHTDRLSGVVVSQSEDPDYERAISVGTNISRIVNSVDGIDDFSPILGSFTSLFVRDDVLVYSNQIKNFQNEDFEFLPIQNWTVENYFEKALISYDTFLIERVRTLDSEFNTTAIGGAETGFFIGNNGTKLFMTENNGNTIGQWSLTTPWDITTATGLTELTLSSSTNDNYTASSVIDLQSIFFNNTGTKLYHIDLNGTVGERLSIYEYSMTQSWNVLTASCVTDAKINVTAESASQITQPSSLCFKPSGDYMYVTDLTDESIFEFKLSIPYQVNTASFIRKSNSIRPPEYYSLANNSFHSFAEFGLDVRSIRFTNDGKKMFLTNSQSNSRGLTIQYNLPEAWNISNVSFVSAIDGLAAVFNRGIELRQDDSDIYTLSQGGNRVYRYKIEPSGDLNFSANDSFTLSNNFSFLNNLVLTRVNHDKNYFKKCLDVLNDYNKMVQLTNVPSPPAIVLIRDLIGTDELKKLL